MTAKINIQHVHKAFRIKRNLGHLQESSQPISALQDIHLEVKQGEFMVIVGPSGCGKSTLLDLLAGLTKALGDVWDKLGLARSTDGEPVRRVAPATGNTQIGIFPPAGG